MPVSLDTVVICNFKSFIDKVIIGPIREITIIVGRNGCGKSNIMDAIRFALGENAKNLRVKHLSELICRRLTEDLLRIKPSEKEIYVDLIFKVDDGTRKSFKRQIYGEISRYKIDNEIVTNEFYITELREMGLDIKAGNFLIPQGYIECFAIQKPKDLTAIFERISNSNACKADYERLKLKLLEAGEKVFYNNQRKKLTLMQSDKLRTEKAEKEKYIDLEKQYNKQQFKFQLIQLLLIKKKVESLQNEEKEIKSQTKQYLLDKKDVERSLERTNVQLKLLSSSLERIEQSILKKKNIVQQRKLKFFDFEYAVSHWQRKHDYARMSLDSANKAHDSKKRIIQELETEFKQIDEKLTELRNASQTSIIEISNSQVKRYMELTNEAECRAMNFMEQINLMRNQQEDHDTLDNENRRKQELEDTIMQKRLRLENLEMWLKKLQDSDVECKAMIIEKTAKKSELNQKITETSNKALSLEKNIEDTKEKLSQADSDNNATSRRIKRSEIIQKLKQLHSGMHDRISDLCKPIHSRYNVAITKVFGKNMDAIVIDTERTAIQCIRYLREQKLGIEIFLPLNSIKKISLKQQLRTIKEPKNVKLLYDVLKISSTEIDKAILFATKNTLVCETIEDARKIAYKSDEKRNSHDCVSLDGTFFRKDGIISGGQVDLIGKGKQWEEQEILILKEQKTQLMQEFRNLPNISLLQSELDIINKQIDGLTIKNKYIDRSIKETENEIINLREELNILNEEIITLNVTISKIQDNIETRLKEIENLEEHVNAIKDEIFVDFCEEINVPNISHFEKNNLRIYQEQKKRQTEFEKQYDRIENQLRFENENDTESKVLKWKHILEQANEELNKAHQQEHDAKIEVEQEETEMSKLKDNYTNTEKDLENVKKTLTQHKSQIRVINELYLESQKGHIAVLRKIEQQKINCNTVLKQCKMKDFNIPISETSAKRLEESCSTTNSSSKTESSESYEVLEKIDFSQFPENMCNCTEEELLDMANQLNENLPKIQNEFADINPNFKVDEEILSNAQLIEEINIDLRTCRNEYNGIKMEFASMKKKRCELFSTCFNCVTEEINSVYQSLVNDTRAQAIIFPDNLEEPYADNIIYHCTVPSKRFLPLQYLSGGEKSLASLALLFAMQRYKQMPFFIMDEVDASLDKANIKNVVRFIESQRNTTLIMISLHKELYSNADGMLVGVTLQRDSEGSRSKVYAISLSRYHIRK